MFLFKMFSAKCPVGDTDFCVHGTTPLLPVNPIWKEERDGMVDVGILLEIQTYACKTPMIALGKVWWPLTQAHISRSLNVSFQNLG